MSSRLLDSQNTTASLATRRDFKAANDYNDNNNNSNHDDQQQHTSSSTSHNNDKDQDDSNPDMLLSTPYGLDVGHHKHDGEILFDNNTNTNPDDESNPTTNIMDRPIWDIWNNNEQQEQPNQLLSILTCTTATTPTLEFSSPLGVVVHPFPDKDDHEAHHHHHNNMEMSLSDDQEEEIIFVPSLSKMGSYQDDEHIEISRGITALDKDNSTEIDLTEFNPRRMPFYNHMDQAIDNNTNTVINPCENEAVTNHSKKHVPKGQETSSSLCPNVKQKDKKGETDTITDDELDNLELDDADLFLSPMIQQDTPSLSKLLLEEDMDTAVWKYSLRDWILFQNNNIPPFVD